jgi:hypothetical protein
VWGLPAGTDSDLTSARGPTASQTSTTECMHKRTGLATASGDGRPDARPARTSPCLLLGARLAKRPHRAEPPTPQHTHSARNEGVPLSLFHPYERLPPEGSVRR